MLSSSVAWADCRDGPNSGSEHLHMSTGSHSAGHDFYSTWATGSRFLNLGIEGGAVPSGYCADSIYDWAVQSGHYDWRIARTCKPGTERYTGGGGGITEPSGPTFTGMQKQALCYYDQSDDINCIWSPLAFSTTCNDPPNTPSYGNWAIAMWIRRSDGTMGYWDAGVPTDPGG